MNLRDLTSAWTIVDALSPFTGAWSATWWPRTCDAYRGLRHRSRGARRGGLLQAGRAAALHHAQEEHELMPLWSGASRAPGARGLQRIAPGARSDHRRSSCCGARCAGRSKPSRRTREKAAGRGHPAFPRDMDHPISAEEASLHLLALRHLRPVDRNLLAQRSGRGAAAAARGLSFAVANRPPLKRR